MRGRDALKEKMLRLRSELFGSAVSPKEFEAQLEKRAEELEERAGHLEKEAQLRKRAAAAKLRVKEAEKEMGRGYGRVLKLAAVVIVVLLVSFAIVQSCEDVQNAEEAGQGVEVE